MISFTLSIIALIIGYFLYGRFVERVFGPDDRVTPAVSKADGLDYIVMPGWKIFMIQFLNIAGTGPIFGAIMGAKFGPASYLWIVLGCIFGGAVHDYLSGMLSLRHDGAGLPALIGEYLGRRARTVMLCFTVLLLILVGAVFVYSPAVILKDLAGDGSNTAFMVWAIVIFLYYIVATMLPIDKIIGKIYPFFAVTLIFMAIALMVGLIARHPDIPEFWDGLHNRSQTWGGAGQPMWPYLFVTIACGAISGFHATQSPLMARCLKNEKLGRPVFYGSMVTEGLVALIWAAVSSYFFFGGGAAEVGGSFSDAAPTIVQTISRDWLGIAGSVLALCGVVAAPISSGDTALRSARLIIADFLHLDQKTATRRLAISIPMFAVVVLLLWFNIANEDGFNVIWRYFGWANQTLSVFTFWALTVFLARKRSGSWYLMTLVPACLMTAVCVTYLCIAQIGFNLPIAWNRWIGAAVIVICLVLFYRWKSQSSTK